MLLLLLLLLLLLAREVEAALRLLKHEGAKVRLARAAAAGCATDPRSDAAIETRVRWRMGCPAARRRALRRPFDGGGGVAGAGVGQGGEAGRGAHSADSGFAHDTFSTSVSEPGFALSALAKASAAASASPCVYAITPW